MLQGHNRTAAGLSNCTMRVIQGHLGEEIEGASKGITCALQWPKCDAQECYMGAIRVLQEC